MTRNTQNVLEYCFYQMLCVKKVLSGTGSFCCHTDCTLFICGVKMSLNTISQRTRYSTSVFQAQNALKHFFRMWLGPVPYIESRTSSSLYLVFGLWCLHLDFGVFGCLIVGVSPSSIDSIPVLFWLATLQVIKR